MKPRIKSCRVAGLNSPGIIRHWPERYRRRRKKFKSYGLVTGRSSVVAPKMPIDHKT
jgi:hypothetical protein